MSLEYVAAYYSYLDYLAELSDAECGRLFKACLTYGKTGAEPELRGNERFVWPGIKSQIDRDAEKYQKRCEQNRNNRQRPSTTVNDRQRPSTNRTKEKEKAKEKEKGNNIPPVSPLNGGSQTLQDVFSDWLAYKREKREAYKPTGLKALETQVLHAAEEYGDDAVVELIRECMANNWRGIIFDRLKGRGRKEAGGSEGRDFTAADIPGRVH